MKAQMVNSPMQKRERKYEKLCWEEQKVNSPNIKAKSSWAL